VILLSKKTKYKSRGTKAPIACGFCAGAGGLSEGLKQAGFDVKFANEINEHAAETYSYNHPDTFLSIKDMRKVSPDEIMGLVGSRVHLVAAGLPCQGFSVAGRRQVNDPRNRLFKSFLNIVNGIRPDFFLIENVVGIMTLGNGSVFEDIKTSFEELGYHVSSRVINSADVGVPQNRRRVFILGSMKDRVDINSMEIRKQKPVTVSDAIGDLDFLKSGESSETYQKNPVTEYQARMKDKSKVLYNHKAPNHSNSTLERFSMMEPGQNVDELPKKFQIKKMVMYRLRPDEPARTITTLPDDYVHYKQDRILTVRELARLQSFNDSYVFLGPRTTGGKRRRRSCPQYSQVGNSVPILLAKSVGKFIMSCVGRR
jgi:DNA (cytosine-5)-methyltransferase 1